MTRIMDAHLPQQPHAFAQLSSDKGIDLHLHTIHSDGQFSPQEVVQRAAGSDCHGSNGERMVLIGTVHVP